MFPEELQTLELLDKDLKSIILKAFKNIKETLSTELKENMVMMSHQTENMNKEINYKKRTKQKFWSLKVKQMK